MRKLLLAAVLAAFPSAVHAQATGLVGYLEGSVSLLLIPNVESEPYAIDTGSGIFDGTVDLDFGNNFMYGVEAGASTGLWRFGVSYDRAELELDSGTAVGTLNGSPFQATVSNDAIGAYGVAANNIFQLIQGNVYYNLPLLGTDIRPYIGLGAGAAIIEHADSELVISATAGMRFALGPFAYMGAKYRYSIVTGPTYDSGVPLEKFGFHTFSVLLGLYFGGP